MWRTDTIWFDATLVCALFAVGNIGFGRFVEHQHRAWRLAKLAVTLAIVLGLAATGHRPWAWSLLAIAVGAVAWVHGVWLPRHGINGWTAEPRDRYEALLASTRRRRRRSPSGVDPSADA